MKTNDYTPDEKMREFIEYFLATAIVTISDDLPKDTRVRHVWVDGKLNFNVCTKASIRAEMDASE